jgi:hypothetical protein
MMTDEHEPSSTRQENDADPKPSRRTSSGSHIGSKGMQDERTTDYLPML